MSILCFSKELVAVDVGHAGHEDGADEANTDCSHYVLDSHNILIIMLVHNQRHSKTNPEGKADQSLSDGVAVPDSILCVVDVRE